MKRCPTCNRLETDEALKFCRVDGATMVGDSSSTDEVGTIKLGSGRVADGTATGVLPQTTDANMNRATATTTVMPPQPLRSTTGEVRIANWAQTKSSSRPQAANSPSGDATAANSSSSPLTVR